MFSKGLGYVRWSFMAQFTTCWFKLSRPRPFFQLWLTGCFPYSIAYAEHQEQRQ